jgi:YVTN family beta-propeller protein
MSGYGIRSMMGGAFLVAATLSGCSAAGSPVAHAHAGASSGLLKDLAGVTHVIATGRRISPVGRVAGTDNFPSSVVRVAGSVFVLSNGATRSQSIVRFQARTLQRQAAVEGLRGRAVGQAVAGVVVLPRQNFFQGLASGPGHMLYAAGGDSDTLLALHASGGELTIVRHYPLQFQAFPKTQYPYWYQGLHGRTRHFFSDGVAISSSGRFAYVTGLLSNSVARVNLGTGAVQYGNAGAYPFAPVLTDHGRRLVVSDWGGCGVTVLSSRTLRTLGRICIGPKTGPGNTDPGVHPTAIAAVAGGSRVLFTASNLDEVVEADARTLRIVRVIDDSPYRHAPPGSYPDGIAVHAGRVYVANAGNNDVAVFDLASGRALGLIPTAWYPTGVAAGHHALFVVCAKGMGSGPNLRHQWVGDMMHGVLQRVPYAQIRAKLAQFTAVARADNGFGRATRERRAQKNAEVARRLRRHIRYVVVILRENKTFDEEFGKFRGLGSWADPHLALYGPRELPNLFGYARRGALFANFYADGEVTAQGHQWMTGASDSDFVQRTWPQYYSGRGLVGNPGWTQSLVPVSRGSGPGGSGPVGGKKVTANPYSDSIDLSVLGRWSNPWIAYPERLYLFNDLQAKHVSFEDFGEFITRSEAGAIPRALRAHVAGQFPGWDRLTLDTERAHVAVNWMRRHARHLPHFMYIWLPDDHTAGRTPCYYTPDYYVANNDEATAQIIHYLSTTAQWKHMAVFITEDDAQSGADHIDAHRTFAVALGPWVRRTLVTKRYSQVNILRTVEAIFRLPPLSQWDANASVISGVWRNKADAALEPIQVPRVPVALNPGTCRRRSLLGRGTTQRASPARVRAAASLPPLRAWYTPTSLLKVPGEEQMRQEWIASKGRASYRRTLQYLRAWAQAHHAPLSQYVANDDGE